MCVYSSLVSRPGTAFRHLQYGKIRRGPGIFSNMSAWAHWAQNSRKSQVTYHMYLAIGGQLSYTVLSMQLVENTQNTQLVCIKLCRDPLWKYTIVSRKGLATHPVSSANFHHFPIMSRSCEKRYQALPAFLYCKRWKVGRGLGTRLCIQCTLHWILDT